MFFNFFSIVPYRSALRCIGEDLNKNGKNDPSQKSVSVLYKGFDLPGQDILSTSRLDFSSRTDADFNPDQPISLTVSSPRLVVKDGQEINGLGGVVDDFDINDSINNKGVGDVAFWVHTSTGDEAVIRAQPPMHKPVLILHGAFGSLATQENYNEWLLNRGLPPEKIQIDPLLGTYDDLIQSFKNAGYVEGEDLFIANYDWRLPPGPDDGIIDGKISGLTADNITDGVYEYGVDYLGYWLRKAAESWNERNPNSPLDSVDVIAHSTGGLVTRSYIESDAYGQKLLNSDLVLPKINNFMMIGVPNRGASKAWNPLHDNWGIDTSYRLISTILRDAYKKVISGQTIKFHSSLTVPGIIKQEQGKPPITPIEFIKQYFPTGRSLLATYPFLTQELSPDPPKTVNGDLNKRNSFLIDLNNGLDVSLPPVDPNAFADKVGKVTVIYSGDNKTPVTVTEHKGEGGEIFSFTTFFPRPSGTETWYEDIQEEAGDGTVPLESSIGQFLQYYSRPGKIELKGFIDHPYDPLDIYSTGHLGLVSNKDVQKLIFNTLNISVPEISTDLEKWILTGGKNILFLKDPVEGFLVDAAGNRLGYTQKDGYLAEIPNSIWFGKEDGIGWIFGEVQDPLTLHLTGLGGNYYVEVGSQQDSEFTGFEDSGFLALGEQKTFVLSVKNHPPIAVDDAVTTNNTNPVTIDVLSNDSDIDTGNTFTIDSVTQSTGGTVIINPNNTLTFTPNANFNGQDTFTYQIKDNAGAKSNPAIVRVTDATRIITVNSTGDQADANPLDDTPDVDLVTPGIQTTLRSAIQFANEKPGKNLIYFNIPTTDPGYNATTGTFTIKPQSALPTIADSIIIDGTTQPGFTGTPIIELNGIDTGINGAVSGLTITAGNSTVRGLVINRFQGGNGISLRGAGGNIIEGNFIGTDVTGTSIGDTSGNPVDDPLGGSDNFNSTSKFLGNGLSRNMFAYDGLSGIFIDPDSTGNIIGGLTPTSRNLISGNGIGITVEGTQNQVQGNYIGTDVTGSVNLGNTAAVIGDFFSYLTAGAGIGMVVTGSNNTIGGTNPAARNLISGNGVVMAVESGDPATFGGNLQISGNRNLVQGNYIGTDITGNGTLSQKSGFGVNITGDENTLNSNLISGHGDILTTPYFSSPYGTGIVISYASGNLLQNNLIGTAQNGTSALGNFFSGIRINGGSENIIGGTISAEGNTIAFNQQGAIDIFASTYEGSGSSGNSIQSNRIFSNVGNGVTTGGNRTTISANEIFANTENGVVITGSENTGNPIVANRIYDNGNLGIDLSNDGVTSNDAGDTDTGTNNLQNYPTLTSVVSGSNRTNLEGTLSTNKANSPFRLDFFANNSADASGFGEGQTLLGTETFLSDNNGLVNFSTNFPTTLIASQFVTATATAMDRRGNFTDTSEFSQAAPVTVSTGPELSINDVTQLEGNSGTTPFTFTVSLSQPSTQTVTVQVETANGTATLFDGDFQSLNSTLTFAPGETSKTVNALVNGDTKPEGNETFYVRLNNATNAAITDSKGAGTIQTDEPLQTVIVVNSIGDQADANPFDGLPDVDLATPGLQTTLRSAIEFANAAPGSNTINFNLPGSAPYIIAPTTELPEIYDSVIIDGTTQPGYSGTPIVSLDGSKVPATHNVQYSSGNKFSAGLNLSAGNSKVKGLEIAKFGAAIWLNTQGNNVIESNYAHDNGFYSGWYTRNGGGVFIDNVANNVIGGTSPTARNILSNNLANGVDIYGIKATNNFIQGNYIGTDATGTIPGSNFTGIWVNNQASNNTIGGTTPEARNLISSNLTGISLDAPANTVQGNYIGTDVTGQTTLGTSGEVSYQYGAKTQYRGLWIAGEKNQIGGAIAGSGNLISGNSQGIYLRSDGLKAKDNLIQGNYIGTAKNGISPLGNREFGIYIQQGYGGANSVPLNNLIGGSVAGAGNVIAFNGSDYSSTPGDDGAGVRIDASGNSVIHNSIFSNLGNGVEVNSPFENANAIQTNRIFSNTKLGIDLGGYGQNEGVTPNDLGDGDIGQNKLQNYPIITAVTSNDSSITVAGILFSTANTLFTLEFFANGEASPSGFGEGENFLGSTVLKTDLAGNATFNLTFSTPISGSQFITTTATDSAGNTSEFSQAFPVTVPILPSLSINDVQLTEGNTDTKPFTFNVSLSAASSSPVTVQYTTSPDSAKAGEDYITTSGTLTFNPGDPLTQTITVPVIGDTTLEPDETFFIYLGSPTNAKVAGGKAVATILNDDAPENHSPVVAANKTLTVLEDAAATPLGIATPTDADNDILSLTINSFPTADKGEIYLNGTKVTQPNSLTVGQLKDLFFVPVANANGSAGTFSYSVSDGKGGTASQTITLDITPVNDPPTVNPIPDQTATEDSPFSFQFSANSFEDVDVGDSLTYSGTLSNGNSLPSWLNFNPDTRTFSGTPTNSDVGTMAIAVQANDGHGGTVSDTFNLTIDNTNDAPTVNQAIAPQTASEDTAFSLTFPEDTFQDVDVGDRLTYTATLADNNPLPLWLNFNGDTRTLSGTPSQADVGSLNLKITATDKAGAFAENIFILEVLNTNDPPIATDDTATTDENTPLSLSAATLLSNDTDPDPGDTLSITSVTNPSNGSIQLDGTNVIFTPTPGFVGQAGFDYSISDGKGGTDTATVNVTVNPVNGVPVALDDSYTTEEDTTLTISAPGLLANDTDVDGDTLTITSNTNPAKGSVTVNADGFFSYIPNPDFNGTDSFTYKVNDGQADSNVATVNIIVKPVNDSPVTVNDSYNVNEDATLNITVPGVMGNDTDVENDPLSAILVGGVNHGTLNFNNNGSFSYTPNANYNGSDSFTYKVNDGQADSNVATVNITVNPINDAPDAVNDIAVTNENTAVTINVLSNDTDIDGDPINLETFTQGTKGTVTLNNNGTADKSDDKLVYTPNANFFGKDSFTYSISDGQGGTDTATVDVTVVSNPPPVAVTGNPQFNFPNDLTKIQPKLEGGSVKINPGAIIYWDMYSFNSNIARVDTTPGTFSSGYAGLKVSIVQIWSNPASGSKQPEAIWRIYVANESSNTPGATATPVNLANNTNIVNYRIVNAAGQPVEGSDKNLVDLINADPLIGNFNNFNNIENAISKSSDGFKTGPVPTVGFSATSDKAWASTIKDGTSKSDAAVTWTSSNGAQGGNDALYGGSNNDNLQGQMGDDLIEGRGGNDTLDGGEGKDYLIGSYNGQTTLLGGFNNDTLFGSYGTDKLTGGAGADTFILRPNFGMDVIKDFNPAEDKIWVWIDRLDKIGATTLGTVAYEQSSGSLFYNNGTDSQILGILETKPLFSDLSFGTNLAANNIFIT